MTIEFKLIHESDIDSIVPLLMQLDPALAREIIEDRLAMMLAQGYECIGVYDSEDLIGICGIWTLVKYYVGKHLEPDNVFIKPHYRGRGIGQQLQTWLERLAISRGCRALELNCYLSNETGLQFWESVGYQRLGVHYQKRLLNNV